MNAYLGGGNTPYNNPSAPMTAPVKQIPGQLDNLAKALDALTDTVGRMEDRLMPVTAAAPQLPMAPPTGPQSSAPVAISIESAFARTVSLNARLQTLLDILEV